MEVIKTALTLRIRLHVPIEESVILGEVTGHWIVPVSASRTVEAAGAAARLADLRLSRIR